MARRKSIGWSITLGVVMIVMVVALAVDIGVTNCCDVVRTTVALVE